MDPIACTNRFRGRNARADGGGRNNNNHFVRSSVSARWNVFSDGTKENRDGAKGRL